MVLLVLAVYFLAVARIVRLINSDKIADRPRLWIARRAVDARDAAAEAQSLGQAVRFIRLDRIAERWGKALYFVQCPWCVGMWVALATTWVPMWFAHNPVAQYIAVALAVSHLVGVCARFADTEDISIEDDDTATG